MTQSRLMRRTGPWSILDSATAAASASRSAPPTFIRPTGEAACAASSCARFLPAVRAMQRATQEEA